MEDMVEDLKPDEQQRGKRQGKTKCCESSEAIQSASLELADVVETQMP
jgi:hypothetical protein